MSVEFIKQLLNENAPKPVVLAGANKPEVRAEDLPFATLGTIFNMAPNDCTPAKLGEAILIASHSLAEDTETDSTVRFEQLTNFLESALLSARALYDDAQPELDEA